MTSDPPTKLLDALPPGYVYFGPGPVPIKGVTRAFPDLLYWSRDVGRGGNIPDDGYWKDRADWDYYIPDGSYSRNIYAVLVDSDIGRHMRLLDPECNPSPDYDF